MQGPRPRRDTPIRPRSVATAPSAHGVASALRERALPVAFQLSTAAVVLYGWVRFPAPFAEHLARLMQLEFLALHAGGFLGIPLMLRPQGTLLRALRMLWLVLMGGIYAAGGYGALGWPGVIELALMIAVTYAGAFTRSRVERAKRTTEIGVRWIGGLMLFGLLAHLFDLPSDVNSWHTVRATLLFAATYFALLAAVESTGFYRWVREIGDVEHPRNDE